MENNGTPVLIQDTYSKRESTPDTKHAPSNYKNGQLLKMDRY